MNTLLLLIALTSIAFRPGSVANPLQQGTQPTEAGKILEIKCTAFIKKPGETSETKLDPAKDKDRKLYPREEVKCSDDGHLKLQIHRRDFQIDKSHGWYSIPEAIPGDDEAPGPGRVGALNGTFRIYSVRSYNLDTLEASVFPMEWRQPLNTPDKMAIELSGNRITMATSTIPKVSFEANGQQWQTTSSDGQIINLSASIKDDRLLLASSLDRERTLEIMISPQPNGELKIVRQLNSAADKPPVVTEAIYRRTSDLASFDVYSPITSPEDPIERFVKEGGRFLAVLNDELSSKPTETGAKFTLTVREPADFRAAIITGHVSGVRRIDEEVELVLSFDTIRLPDGRSYRFTGAIGGVSDGDEIAAKTSAMTQAAGAVASGISSRRPPIRAVGDNRIRFKGSTVTGHFQMEKGTEMLIRAARFGPKL